jgi:drug/metabolite transporter (DMT)-like permease
MSGGGKGQGLRGAGFALAGAALFGASAPLSKLLLPDAHPLVLSALLYLGAGAGLTAFSLAAKAVGASRPQEARLRRADLPVLAGMILLGGVLGPVLMLLGLARVSGMAGSLLLNLEAPLTVLAAVALFGEHLGRAQGAAAVLIVAGSVALGMGPSEVRASAGGIALLAGACAAWALDNNLSARLSLRDPVAVVRAKTLCAGAFAFALSRALRLPLPAPRTLAAALLLGAFAYGLSLVLVLRAQRLLGAARQALWFGTAPFLGALLSVPLLGERPRPADALAVALMIAGVALLRRERHSHPHLHAPLEHEHVHAHDEHHRHAHAGPWTEPHTHLHRHEAVAHEHLHAPDAHHRHGHR